MSDKPREIIEEYKKKNSIVDAGNLLHAAEKLEAENKAAYERIKKLEDACGELAEALRFYANEWRWDSELRYYESTLDLDNDEGKKAREVLRKHNLLEETENETT